MIPNITTGSNVKGMVYYNSNKLTDPDKDKRAQFLGVNNMIASTPEQINAFITNRNRRNVTVKNPNIHISLSFPHEEVLDNTQMMSIADRYMSLMNYGEQPYAIYRHYDRKHPHIHIVSTQINIEGKKISDSNIFYRSTRVARKIEKEFKLIPALSKGKKYSKELDINAANGITDYLNISIRNALLDKPTDFKQFDKLILTYGINRVEKEGGYFFQFDNTYNEALDSNNIYKVNILDLDHSKDELIREFKRNSIDKIKYIKQVQAKIFSITDLIKEPLSIEELQLRFLKKGLTIEFKRITNGAHVNSINKIFVTDKLSNIIYSASDLKIRTKSFVDTYVYETIIKTSKLNLDNSEPVLNSIEKNHFEAIKEFEFESDLVDQLLFLFNQSVSNNEDDVLLKKRKKRKKK